MRFVRHAVNLMQKKIEQKRKEKVMKNTSPGYLKTMICILLSPAEVNIL